MNINVVFDLFVGSTSNGNYDSHEFNHETSLGYHFYGAAMRDQEESRSGTIDDLGVVIYRDIRDPFRRIHGFLCSSTKNAYNGYDSR